MTVNVLPASAAADVAAALLATGSELVALDTETSPAEVPYKEDGVVDEAEAKVRGLDPYRNRLRLVQLSTGDLTYVLTMDHQDPKVLLALAPLFENVTALLVNAAFDLKMLRHHAGLLIPKVWDLSLAERALLAGKFVSNSEWYVACSFAGLAKTYLGLEVDKTIRAEFSTGVALTEEQIEYAAQDVALLPKMSRLQRTLVEEQKLLTAVNIENGAISGVVEMELTGMYLDRERWLELARQAEQKRRQLYDDLQLSLIPRFYKDYFGEERVRSLGLKIFDPNSTFDTRRAFSEVGVDLADCREQTVVAALTKYPEHRESIQALLDYKDYLKRSTAFGEEWLRKYVNPVTGKVHCHYDQYGAVTARASCNSPNLQQIPARGDEAIEYRKCFRVPDEDELCVVSVDWAAAEMRIMAWYSQEPLLLEAFNGDPPKDPHSLGVCAMFGFNYEKFAKRLEDGDLEAKKLRTTMKNCVFGKAYGAGPPKLAVTAGVSVEEAKQFIIKQERSMPRLTQWLNEAGKAARENLQVRGIAGHRRFFVLPDRSELTGQEYAMRLGSMEREGKNYKVQNTNAVWLKRVLHVLPPRIEPYGALLYLMVHDELVLLAHPFVAQEVADITVQTMIEVGEYFLRETPTRQAVRVQAEAHIAPWWSK